MQSGESEPLDLGLPISNLDGLRVVLDIADHTSEKGKKHTHTYVNKCRQLSHITLKKKSSTLSFIIVFYQCCYMCLSLFPSFIRQTESSSL